MSIKPNPYESIRRISEVGKNRQSHYIESRKKASTGKYRDIYEAIKACADVGWEYLSFFAPDSPEVISNLTTIKADGFKVSWERVNLSLYVSIQIP